MPFIGEECLKHSKHFCHVCKQQLIINHKKEDSHSTCEACNYDACRNCIYIKGDDSSEDNYEYCTECIMIDEDVKSKCIICNRLKTSDEIKLDTIAVRIFKTIKLNEHVCEYKEYHIEEEEGEGEDEYEEEEEEDEYEEEQ